MREVKSGTLKPGMREAKLEGKEGLIAENGEEAGVWDGKIFLRANATIASLTIHS